MGANQSDEKVDNSHKQAAENSRLCRIDGNPLRLLDAIGAQNIDYHNAEGQTGQCIQRIIAFQEAGEESAALGGIPGSGSELCNPVYGIQKRSNDQCRQKHKEYRIQHFANPGHNSAGL